MADIIEYIYRGASAVRDNPWDWILKEDGVAIVGSTPTRLVLTLTPADGATGDVITCDTADLAYALGAPGGPEQFRWDSTTAELIIDFGGEDIATFPAGKYLADLYWYDTDNPNGIRWGRQLKRVAVE